MNTLNVMEVSEEGIRQMCKASLFELRAELETIWDTASQKYYNIQLQESKGPPRYAYLSLLRTGVLTNQAWFQLDLKDNQGWGDIADCTEDWWLRPILARLDFTAESSMVGQKYIEEAEVTLERKTLKLASQLLEIISKNGIFLLKTIKHKHPEIVFSIGEYMKIQDIIN